MTIGLFLYRESGSRTTGLSWLILVIGFVARLKRRARFLSILHIQQEWQIACRTHSITSMTDHASIATGNRYGIPRRELYAITKQFRTVDDGGGRGGTDADVHRLGETALQRPAPANHPKRQNGQVHPVPPTIRRRVHQIDGAPLVVVRFGI